MYEVAGANAYSPDVWTPLRRPNYGDPFASPPRSPSPTKAYTPRRPLLPTHASPSTPPVPLPRIPQPPPTRYRNSPSRSPERNRRPRGGSIDHHSRSNTLDSSDSRWAPIGATGDVPRLMHHTQASPDYVAPLTPNAAYSPERNSAMRDNRFTRNFSTEGMYTDTSPKRNLRRDSEFVDIDPEQIDDHDDPFHDSGYAARDTRKTYDVGGPSIGAAGLAANGGNGRAPRGGDRHNQDEKAAWKDMESRDQRKRKRKLLIIGAVVFLIVVIGAAVGGVLGSKASHNSSSTTASSSSSTSGSSSDNNLDANSDQVKALLNNTSLHRVFPALDYTGVNMQYPACLTNPPIQDNVTLDMALMSQLTPTVRTYGTDCNQTEMVLTAISRLGLNATTTVWLGVWLSNNATTNTRQLSQMYSILRTYPITHFKGVIVGNEVLFRKDMTLAQLGATLQSVKKNLTAMGIDLPVATSDLGSDWSAQLLQYTDVVMANVHPFFAGVTAAAAANWTDAFFQSNDVALTTTTTTTTTAAAVPAGGNSSVKAVISEVGWPSQGGNDCGTGNTCASATAGSVAGIDELNAFMDGWVCQAMENGTEYFWFEAFDEPWKSIYDTGSDGWEDHWGLMTVDRKLKDNVKIPDCGGKTIDG